MKKISLLIFLLIIYITVFAQKNQLEKNIVDEGKKLYCAEMASRYGSDVLLEKYPEQTENIIDCFSYSENKITKCIFVSNEGNPKVIATVSFDSTFDTHTATIDKLERNFTANEKNLFAIKKSAIAEINSGIIYVTYKNTSLHFIPLISGLTKKVFVITVPNKNGVVYFGNDYLFTFDSYNKLKSKKLLHKYITAIDYSGNANCENKGGISAMHSHSAVEGEIITSTDICIIMLNEKAARWVSHLIVADNKVCVWSCDTNTLAVMSKNAFAKMSDGPEKRKNRTNLIYN